MEFLFCKDALNKNQVDEAYHEELKAVNKLGIPYNIFDFEKLVEGDAIKAVRNIGGDGERLFIYRGWMLDPDNYNELFKALLLKNIKLINNPDQYVNTHWFPLSYDTILKHTPLIFWAPKSIFNIDNIEIYTRHFENKPIIIKDYVKSEKHFWHEACFCPDASDTEHVKNVIRNFMKLRDIEGGIVFKEFVDLECVQFDPILKTQTAKEYRLFFLNGKIIDCSKYWESNEYNELPPLELFENIGKNISSVFFTMDVAKKKSGEWIIIEVGDGQVSGLVKNCDIEKFYNKLKSEYECQVKLLKKISKKKNFPNLK